MHTPFSAKRLHQFFDISIALKGIDGALEIIGGIILMFISPAQIGWLTYMLTRDELSDDPSDLISNFLMNIGAHVTPHGKFVSVVFLLSHGLVKVFLVWELFKGRLWAYPLTIITLIFFIIYQIFQIVHGHSVLLMALTVLDGLIVVLAWWEYQQKKKLHASKAS